MELRLELAFALPFSFVPKADFLADYFLGEGNKFPALEVLMDRRVKAGIVIGDLPFLAEQPIMRTSAVLG